MRRPSGVLDDSGTSGGEVALCAIAEPAGPRRDVRVFGDAKLRARLLNEIAVIPQRARDTHRVHRPPAVFTQQILRSIDRELERLSRLRREIDESHEFLILVA